MLGFQNEVTRNEEMMTTTILMDLIGVCYLLHREVHVHTVDFRIMTLQKVEGHEFRFFPTRLSPNKCGSLSPYCVVLKTRPSS